MNEQDRFRSKCILALKLGCLPEEVKNKIFEKFDSHDIGIQEFENLKIKHESGKESQALKYNMHPDDTPAGLFVEMIQEYINNLERKKKSDDLIFKELATENEELMSQVLNAIGSGDKELLSELMKKNPEFLESFLNKMAENEGKVD